MSAAPNVWSLAARVASSGDPVLDRRREWALAASAEGFHLGAIEIYEQILERAPYWALAWFELGSARLALGDREGAIAAFEAAHERDPDGLLAAGLHLAALGARETPARAPPAYVAGLFDQYAAKFERHLVGDLDYRGPALLRAAIAAACDKIGRAKRFDIALDLGCGTGLMGLELQPSCAAIRGVDISANMAEAARRSGAYETVHHGDIIEFLAAAPGDSVSLIVAADVFVYIGDLAPIFAETARVLRSGGLLCFSVQKSADHEFVVGDDMRYAHSDSYVRRMASAAGLDVIAIDEQSTRKDRGKPTPGLIATMMKP